MSNLYIICPSQAEYGNQYPYAIVREGVAVNFYQSVEDAYSEWVDYGSVIVWDEPCYETVDLEFDPEGSF